MWIDDEHFGPCLNWSLLDEPVRDLFEFAVDMATVAFQDAKLTATPTPLPYPVRICFPNKGTFNAATCDQDQGGSVIAINAGVPYLIFGACYIYSTRADSRTGLPIHRGDRVLVYDDSLELIGRLQEMPAVPADYSALFERLVSTPQYRDANFTYALYLYSIAMRFFVMHEVMHIVLGHTAYLRDTLAFSTLVEFGGERETKLDPELSHCLEFLADRHSIRGVARKLANRDPNFMTKAQEQLSAQATVDENSYVLRAVMTAVTLMFHLYPARDEIGDGLIGSHPDPYVRTQWLALELGHEFGGQCDYVNAVLLPLAETAATMMSNFRSPGRWRSTAQGDVDHHGSAKSPSDVAYERILVLAQRWSTMIYQRYGPKFVSGAGVLIP